MVDRIGPKRASIAADVTSAVIVASIPTLQLLGILRFWELLVLVFLLSSVNTQGDTARSALVPGLARMAGMSRERANAADRSVVRIGALVGPVLGGILAASSRARRRAPTRWPQPAERRGLDVRGHRHWSV